MIVCINGCGKKVCGQNQRALGMRAWDQFLQDGREYVKTTKMPLFIATGSSLSYIFYSFKLVFNHFHVK